MLVWIRTYGRVGSFLFNQFALLVGIVEGTTNVREVWAPKTGKTTILEFIAAYYLANSEGESIVFIRKNESDFSESMKRIGVILARAKCNLTPCDDGRIGYQCNTNTIKFNVDDARKDGKLIILIDDFVYNDSHLYITQTVRPSKKKMCIMLSNMKRK